MFLDRTAFEYFDQTGTRDALEGLNGPHFRYSSLIPIFELSFIIIDPAGMVPLVALRRTKKPGSARAGTCRDHAINGPRSWTTQSRGTPAIDAQRTKLAQAASRHS